ncbi:transposase [Desertimonas flava]|uniref:transposase n=1 Tax=Desertimonas flava TaxID=2064846 RepID=UPI000E34CFC5|nr:transposase [Desertimonas flava]
MPRALRPDDPGGIYHVMNRGGAHRTIFHAAVDGRRFLDLIGQAAELHHVHVLAYCLMTNHYHLLVSCPDGGLSKFMHRVGSLYARHHNDRLGRDGPICRDRFRSLLIDSDAYLANAGRYIHRNPLDIRPQPALDEYPWSSYRYYVTEAPAPPWLSTTELLEPFTNAAGYRSVVEGPVSGFPVDWAVDTAILELGDGEPSGIKVRRTVLLAMLDRAGPEAAARLAGRLTFTSTRARAMATLRMRRALSEHPGVVAVVERAAELAA